MVTQNIKLNVKLNLPDMKAFDKMMKTGINSALKVLEPIPIVFNIEKSLEQAIEFFDKTIEHMSDKISEEVSDETVNLANIFENFTRRAVVGIGIITAGFFGLENFIGLSKNSLTTIATSTNHLFAGWVENSERLFKTLGKFLSRLSSDYSYFMQGIGKSISSWSPMIGAVFDNLSAISEELVKKIASIVNLMNSIDYSWFVKTVTSLLGVTVEVNSTISYFLFFITKFSAWSLLVTSVGIGFKTLKRAWSFMFTSDEGSPKKALHGFMTYASTIGEVYKIKVTTFKHFFHSAVFTGAALFTSQFSKAFSLTAIFAGLAAQSFMSLIGNAIKRASLRTQSFMGSSRAQILMIALNMKDILYTVSNIGYAFMKLDPKKKMDMLSTLVAKFIIEVAKKIQKEFGWIGKIFGDIFGSIWSRIATIFSSFKSVFRRADPVQKTKMVLGQIFTVVDGYIQKIVSRIIEAIARIKMPARLDYNVGPQIKPNRESLAAVSEVSSAVTNMARLVDQSLTHVGDTVRTKIVQPLESIGATAATLSTTVPAYFGIIGTSIQENVAKPIEAAKEALKNLSKKPYISKEYSRAERLAKLQGSNIWATQEGGKFESLLRTDLEDARKYVTEVIKEFIQVKRVTPELRNITTTLITSIKGNLKARRISEGFVNQLIEGLKKDFPKLNVPLETLLNNIMKYFPRSPAEKGPLKNLAYSGAQIPVQLALGIAKNAKVVIDAINKVVAAIKEPIDKVIPTLMLSERLGMSTSEVETMDFALKNFGSTASELEFILGRLSTNREALKGIGLDMAEIEKTSNPALTTFLLLSERLREVKQGTVEYGKILEAAGVTATSGLVNVMLAGNEKFQEFRLKALELGAITQKGQQENAKQAHELEVAWSGFTTGITNAFWLEVMPAIDALFEGLMEVFTKADANGINFINRLHAIARVIGHIAKLASKIIVDIVHLAVTEPEKAKVIFIKFLDALYSTASTFFGGLNGNVKAFLYSLVNLVLNIAWSFLKTLWTLIKTTAKIAGKDISISFASSIIDTFAGFASSEKGMSSFSALYDYFGGARMRELQFAMLETVYDSQTQAENTFSKIMTDLGTEVKKDFEGTGDAIVFLNDSMANTGNMSENISQAFKKAADEFSKFAIEVKGTPLEASVNDLLKGLYEIPTAYEQATAAHVTATKRLRQDIEKSNKVIADGVKEPAKVLDSAVDETQKKMASLVVDSMQKFGEVLDNIYKASNEKLKAIFYLQKGMAIATATVQGALAVINAYNDLSVPSVIMRTINAAMIAAKVASQIAVMTAETLGFNSGGKVGDAVGPNKDSIPAMLTSGEFVLNRSAVAKYGEDFLYGLNSLKFNTYRNLGGSVPTVSTPTIQPQKQPPINITNVNYVDKDEFGKFLATTHGQNMVINIISNNRTTVKRIIG